MKAHRTKWNDRLIQVRYVTRSDGGWDRFELRAVNVRRAEWVHTHTVRRSWNFVRAAWNGLVA